MLRDSTPRFVRPSVGWSVGWLVGWSHFYYLNEFYSLNFILILPKWFCDPKYSPCPPARDCGSRVSGLVSESGAENRKPCRVPLALKTRGYQSKTLVYCTHDYFFRHWIAKLKMAMFSPNYTSALHVDVMFEGLWGLSDQNTSLLIRIGILLRLKPWSRSHWSI